MALSGLNSPVTRAQSPVDPVTAAAGFKRTHILTAAGILSDMDGTLIESTNAVIKHWQRVGEMYKIDPATILATSHGRRSIDVFQQIDPDRATWDYIRQLESDIPEKWGDDAVEIPGARTLIETLEGLQQASGAKWAIVTSGTRPLVEGWLKVLGLAEPGVMVTAEAVEHGKPDPECYRLAAKKLGLDLDSTPTSTSTLTQTDAEPKATGDNEAAVVLVLEDAPAGIRAGKAAGFKVLALATTHHLDELKAAGADWIVRDLTSVKVQADPHVAGRLEVQISNILG